MKKLISIIFIFLNIVTLSAHADVNAERGAMLKFSDGRVISELSEINEILYSVGVHLERFEVPKAAIPLLESALEKPLSKKQTAEILRIFALSREDVIAQANKAGRQPVLKGGGSMKTGEVGVAPYPKVYDLKAMSDADRLYARNKFARLHVNSTKGKIGVDEVMTLPVGGAWTWYFQVGDQAVELHMSKVKPGEKAWRLSYPGTTPHGGNFFAESGLCIAYITGPEVWRMKYVAPEFDSANLLGTNPFIDFSD